MARRLKTGRLHLRNTLKGSLALVATAVLLGGVQAPSTTERGVAVGVVRSYRGESRTQVDAFLQVPYNWIASTQDNRGGMLSYQVSVQVTDSTGLTLVNESWQNHADGRLRGTDASGVEVFHFSLAPGRYQLAVEVKDSISGQAASSAIQLQGFASPPPASDLLLSPQIRMATGSDSVPQAAEVRWGPMVVTAAAELELTALRSTAFYLLEAYSVEPATGTLEMIVRDSAGKTVVRTAPNSIQVAAGGGVLHGRLDLAGLPPGPYTMKALVDLGHGPIERSANFLMHGVGETLEKEVARQGAARVTDEGYFGEMNRDSVEAAEAPLESIAESEELAGWDKSLSLAAKRRFLARFWTARDPTTGTPRNEAREDFYRKVDFANREYREAGRGGPAGWRSDRGRIFLRNGPPDDVKQQGAHGEGGRLQSRALAWEVWRYTSSGKDRFYIFVDRTGLGTFKLVRSNDVKENGLVNWNEFFGRDDLDEIGRFLGQDVFR
jgi:GWxTD domain-containing protein